MGYGAIAAMMTEGLPIVLDGGTGAELERRGVPMDREAWSATACLEHPDVLVAVHRDYIEAGARVVTANTFASSRPMLEAAGLGDRVEEVNEKAISCAQRARDLAGVEGVAVAASISHWTEGYGGREQPTAQNLADTFGEMAGIAKGSGADLILLEMMYDPERIPIAAEAAVVSGLPVWMGLSARRGEDGEVLSFLDGRKVAFENIARLATEAGVAAAGVMHTPSDLTAEALAILRSVYDGPTYAYPDSGYFEMPNWRFEDVITPERLAAFAKAWRDGGAAAIGGCCGLGVEHIRAISEAFGD